MTVVSEWTSVWFWLIFTRSLYAIAMQICWRSLLKSWKITWRLIWLHQLQLKRMSWCLGMQNTWWIYVFYSKSWHYLSDLDLRKWVLGCSKNVMQDNCQEYYRYVMIFKLWNQLCFLTIIPPFFQICSRSLITVKSFWTVYFYIINYIWIQWLLQVTLLQGTNLWLNCQ